MSRLKRFRELSLCSILVLTVSVACSSESNGSRNAGITNAEALQVAEWPPIVRQVSSGSEGTTIEWQENSGADGFVESYQIYRRLRPEDSRTHTPQPDEWSLVGEVSWEEDTESYTFLDRNTKPDESYDYKLTPILKGD